MKPPPGADHERTQGVILWTLDRHGLRSCHYFYVKPGWLARWHAWRFGSQFHRTWLVWPKFDKSAKWTTDAVVKTDAPKTANLR